MGTMIAATLGAVAAATFDRWRNSPPPRPGA